MPVRLNLKGKSFGRLMVTKFAGIVEYKKSGGKQSLWRCKCQCGKSVTCVGSALVSGNTKSCGCFKRERIGDTHRKHGMSGTKEHRAWVGMKRRCLNPNRPRFKHYGGRGIKVCKRWQHSFENFYADVGPAPSKRHSIDRKRVNGHYYPSNVQWATPGQQAANQRRWL